MRNVVLLVVLGAGAVALVPQATARQQGAKRLHSAGQVAPELGSALLRRIAAHRDETWRWQRVMLQPRTPFRATARHATSLSYRKWVLGLWQRRATAARRRAHRPPHRAQWLCIHRYEGPWGDPGAPYYGGLQMDVRFQQTYALDLYRAKGTADHWSPLEQMWVAERAYRTRGFLPWPNTARFCGLL
ncbi:MAG TPA: hypothetical protein VH816_14685 [Gaiellaceae bacterium]